MFSVVHLNPVHSIVFFSVFFFFIDESSNSLIEISKDYDTDYVRQSLREHGCPPGPLVPSTKRLYIRKLHRLLADLKHNNNDQHIRNSFGIFLNVVYLSLIIHISYFLFHFRRFI